MYVQRNMYLFERIHVIEIKRKTSLDKKKRKKHKTKIRKKYKKKER